MGLFRSDNDRNIKRLKKTALVIDALEEKYKSYSDDKLKKQTEIFKKQFKDGASIEDILPEAFAVVREASSRVLRMRHYFVQLIGGIALHQGRIAEMRTGEGKTLVETLPAYLNALTGDGVHIITVNEYLASRDAEWMGKIFNFLGLSVGVTLSGMNREQKKKAYLCDITYGTNSEMGFDYLRDNMVVRKEDKVQRPLNFAIVDEVDSVLIDEARTPLIISGGRENISDDNYVKANNFVRGLKSDDDVEYDEEKKSVRLTESGIEKAERYYGITNLSDIEHIEINHYILNALKARYVLIKDSKYIVKDGKVLIVDEYTGRVLAGRRFGDGLHEAVEAKENVEINKANKTMATITYQNYFRLFNKLSGMTGTAKTEEAEFNAIYNLDVVVIPTNKPIIRIDNNDLIFKTIPGKKNNIIQEIEKRHEKGQPILVGTTTVDKSEMISNELKRKKIRHNVLNAKNHEKESEVIAQAGRIGAITIATNMAGRGTDILLGGNPEFLAKQKLKLDGFEEKLINETTSYTETDDIDIINARKKYNTLFEGYLKETEKEKNDVKNLGGLFVLATERHESRRIDNQLRGRAGRQGDPGESSFYISLEDDLARVFGGPKIKSFISFLKIDDNTPIANMKIINKQIEGAQKRVEGRNFGIRKTILQFDNVLSKQREIIYNERNKVLEGEEVTEQVYDMVYGQVTKTVGSCAPEDKYEPFDYKKLNIVIEERLLEKDTSLFNSKNIKEMNYDSIVELVYKTAIERYELKQEEAQEQNIDFKQLERTILLKCVDEVWVEHIDHMTILKNEIFTRTDPLTSYKQEAFEMFDSMINKIREKTSAILLNATIQRIAQTKLKPKITVSGPVRVKTVVNKSAKVGRNDLCPCGSGKKYKNCCINK